MFIYMQTKDKAIPVMILDTDEERGWVKVATLDRSRPFPGDADCGWVRAHRVVSPKQDRTAAAVHAEEST